MTATFDATIDRHTAAPRRTRKGLALLKCASRRLSGVAFLAVAVGLWLEPGAQAHPDLIVIKLGLSLFLGVAGVMILRITVASTQPEIEIDTIRREVRIVRQKCGGRAVVSGTAIRDLGMAEEGGMSVKLWLANGTLLADVPTADPKIRARLTNVLRDEGKL